MDRFDGYKTYLIAAATVVYAVAGWVIGQLDGGTAAQLVATALSAAGLRHGIRTGA